MKKINLLLFLLLQIISLQAQPSTISYQGVLTDDAGALINGTRNLIFQVYDASSEGNLLATDTHNDVIITDGLFNVELSLGSVDFSQELWLEITVESTVLTPRIAFNASGYALASPNYGMDNFTGSYYSYDSKYGVKLTPNSAQTYVDFVIQPKGVAAIIAQQPDGTTTGGNKRGGYAIDLQMTRDNASQVASGFRSVIIGGASNTASGEFSTALGFANIASGSFSTVMGIGNSASGLRSTAFGHQNTASGDYSTAMGNSSDATANSSFAAGKDALASGDIAVAIGNGPTASGYASLAMGDYTTASGRISTAFGNRTTAPSANETVFGKYNSGYTPASATDWILTDRLFVVGNGASDVTKTNALTILKNANTTIGGSLTINGNGTDASVTFPTTRGTNGQVLKTNADGTTQWASAEEPGTVAGQMKYWNGSAWVTVAAGTEGQILKFVGGVPTWVTDDFVNNLQVGDFYQGGIIAYFLQSGDTGYDPSVRHGIIAAPSDQSTSARWGCRGTAISGADGEALGTGEQNTLDIAAGCSTVGIAAQICNDLVLNGYSDWYLPSRDELGKLYLNREAIGGFSDNSSYWSSTEDDIGSEHAYFIQFNSLGNPASTYKDNLFRVRAVRSF